MIYLATFGVEPEPSLKHPKAVQMFGPMLWPQGPVGPPLSTVQQEHRKFGTGRPDPSTQGISRGKWCSSTWLTGRNVNVVTWIC